MKLLTILFLLASPLFSIAQSKVMRELSDEYPDSFVLMFYHSSLNMLNIDDDPDFARMIQDIEKIKVLRINKDVENFTETSLVDLKGSLSNRGFEELMIVKNKDMNIGVYINEDDGDVEGFFLLMDENDEFIAIDVLGSMPVGDIGQLVDKIKQANAF